MQILGQKMSAKDEAKTRRIDIDTLLQECGFILQDKSEFNRLAKVYHIFARFNANL